MDPEMLARLAAAYNLQHPTGGHSAPLGTDEDAIVGALSGDPGGLRAALANENDWIDRAHVGVNLFVPQQAPAGQHPVVPANAVRLPVQYVPSRPVIRLPPINLPGRQIGGVDVVDQNYTHDLHDPGPGKDRLEAFRALVLASHRRAR